MVIESTVELAERMLSPLGERWLHVQEVARKAAALGVFFAREDAEVLVTAAWLHDIGYAADVVDTGFHALDGARFVARCGYPDRVVRLVAHHSGARYEAKRRKLEEEIDAYRFEDSAVMDALVCADMTTGPAGQTFTFSERIQDIRRRYDAGSPVCGALDDAEPYLRGATAEAAILAGGIRPGWHAE